MESHVQIPDWLFIDYKRFFRMFSSEVVVFFNWLSTVYFGMVIDWLQNGWKRLIKK